MSVIKSKLFLQNLIQTGPDASLNLFAVNFLPFGETDYDNMLSLRTTQFPTPKRDVSTASLLYQNIELKKLVPSSSIDREITFNVRVDNYYNILSKLRSKQAIDDIGLFDSNEEDSYTIIVDALRPYMSLGTTEQYITAYRWIFYDAYIKNIGSMNFSYESAATGTTTVGFVYSRFEEFPYDISMENKKFKKDIEKIATGIKESIARRKAAKAADRAASEDNKEASDSQ